MKKSQTGFAAILFVIIFIVVIVLVGAVGTYAYKARQDASNRSKPLMIVTSSGGLCASQCNHPVYKLYPNGKFTGGGYRDLNSSEVTKLKTLIKDTDFLKYAPNPHPKCESFMDGSDQVLLFPQKYGNRTFTTCMMSISSDDPAFTYIDGLLETHFLRAD